MIRKLKFRGGLEEGLSRIVHNIGWLFFDRIVRMGLGLFVNIWLARYLGAEQFGELNYALAIVAILSPLSILGFSDVVVREFVQNPEKKLEIASSAFIFQIVGGIIAYLILYLTVQVLHASAHTKIVILIIGISLLVKAHEVANYWFESQVLSKYTVWIQNTVFICFAGLKIGLIISGASLILISWTIAFEAIILSILLILNLYVKGIQLQWSQFSWYRSKSLLKDSWPLLLSGLAVVVYMRIDQLMLGSISGNESVGIYSAAVRISEVWYFIPMTVIASVFPSILKSKAQNEKEYYHRIQLLFDLLVWIAILISVPMTFLADSLISILYGAEFAEASVVLMIHIWASIFVFLGVASGKWFVAENMERLSLHRTLLGVVINILLNLLLIPRYGVIGAAWATIMAQASAALLFDLFQKKTRRVFWMKINTLNILKYIINKY